MVYELIPRVKEEWLSKIMRIFSDRLKAHRVLSEMFFVIENEGILEGGTHVWTQEGVK